MSGINLDTNLSYDSLNLYNQENVNVNYQTIAHIDLMEELQTYIATSIKSH